MRIGVAYPQIELGGDPDAARHLAIAVERLGYAHLLAYDHVLGAEHAGRTPPLSGPYTERDPFHDPLVLFAHLAALTTDLELVTGILVLPQRQTALVARQAADVDLLSGGRLRLGVGVGWNPVEFEALGQDFAGRGARMEEQVDVLRRLWTEPVVDFAGASHRIDRAALLPRPHRPIPIWFGGFGERSFRRAARIGDGFIFGGPDSGLVAALGRVRSLVAEAGRDPATFGADIVVGSNKGPAAVADKVHRWRAAGGSHATVLSLGLGFDSASAHEDYLGEVAQHLGVAAR